MSNKNLHAQDKTPARAFSQESVQAIITRINEIELSLAEIESVRREIAVLEQKIKEFYKQEVGND